MRLVVDPLEQVLILGLMLLQKAIDRPELARTRAIGVPTMAKQEETGVAADLAASG